MNVFTFQLRPASLAIALLIATTSPTALAQARAKHQAKSRKAAVSTVALNDASLLNGRWVLAADLETGDARDAVQLEIHNATLATQALGENGLLSPNAMEFFSSVGPHFVFKVSARLEGGGDDETDVPEGVVHFLLETSDEATVWLEGSDFVQKAHRLVPLPKAFDGTWTLFDLDDDGSVDAVKLIGRAAHFKERRVKAGKTIEEGSKTLLYFGTQTHGGMLLVDHHSTELWHLSLLNASSVLVNRTEEPHLRVLGKTKRPIWFNPVERAQPTPPGCIRAQKRVKGMLRRLGKAERSYKSLHGAFTRDLEKLAFNMKGKRYRVTILAADALGFRAQAQGRKAPIRGDLWEVTEQQAPRVLLDVCGESP